MDPFPTLQVGAGPTEGKKPGLWKLTAIFSIMVVLENSAKKFQLSVVAEERN